MTFSASPFNPLNPVSNPTTKLVMASLSLPFISLRSSRTNHWNSLRFLFFCELPQQAIHAVNLVQYNLMNIGAVTAQETSWCVVSNTSSCPKASGRLELMLIGRKQRFRISELNYLVHQSIWSLILSELYLWSKQASHGYCKPDNASDRPGSFSHSSLVQLILYWYFQSSRPSIVSSYAKHSRWGYKPANCRVI